MHSAFRIYSQGLCPFFATAAIAVLLTLSSGTAAAQSAAQYRQWLEWCRSIGGTPSGSASNPVCFPGQQQGPTEEQLRFARAKEKHDQALQLWGSGDWDRIIPLLEEAVAIWADPAFVSNLNKARDAREAKIKRGHYLRYFNAGNTAYDATLWEDAIRNYEAALAIMPNDPSTLRNLQLARQQLARRIEDGNKAAASAAAIKDSIQQLQISLNDPVASDKYYRLGANLADTLDNISMLLDDKSFEVTEHQGRVEAILQILATRWSIALSEQASAAQRKIVVDQAKDALREILKKAIDTSAALMVKDAKRLEPWWWNPFGWEQRAIIAQTETQIADAKSRAINDIQGKSVFAEMNLTSGSRLQFNSSAALVELRHINRTVNWDK